MLKSEHPTLSREHFGKSDPRSDSSTSWFLAEFGPWWCSSLPLRATSSCLNPSHLRMHNVLEWSSNHVSYECTCSSTRKEVTYVSMVPVWDLVVGSIGACGINDGFMVMSMGLSVWRGGDVSKSAWRGMNHTRRQCWCGTAWWSLSSSSRPGCRCGVRQTAHMERVGKKLPGSEPDGPSHGSQY